MSTKIYNGYKMKALSTKELHEFYKDTRKIANEVMEEKYFDLFARKMLKIAYDLERIKNDDEKLEHYLVDLYLDSVYRDHKKYINNTKEFVINDMRKSFFENKYPEKIKSLTESILMNKSMHSVFKSKNSPYYFSAEFAILPLEDKTLVIIYDNDVSAKLAKNKEFCEKYGFEYYGYWDNVDKPDEISEEKWNQRKQEWDNIKKTPAEECICFSFGYEKSIEFPVLYGNENKEKILNYIKNNIVKKQKQEAFELAFEEWCSEKQIENVSTNDVFKFDRLYRDKDDAIKHLFEKALKNVEKKFGWIDEKIVDYTLKDFLENKGSE